MYCLKDKNFNIAAEQLLQELGVGKTNAKTASGFSLPPRELRYVVNKLRKKGYPICSGMEGYWLAANEKELRETLNILRSRATDLTHTIEGLSRRMEDIELWTVKNE